MTMVTCVQNMERGQCFGIGAEVENDDVRFFVGSINSSRDFCSIDKTKPWTLKNEKSPRGGAMNEAGKEAALLAAQEGLGRILAKFDDSENHKQIRMLRKRILKKLLKEVADLTDNDKLRGNETVSIK